MTNLDYMVGALSTEAPVTDELLYRATRDTLRSALSFEVAAISEKAERIDRIKKHIFYGGSKTLLWLNDERNKNPSMAPELVTRMRVMIRALHGAIGLVTESVELLDRVAQYLFEPATSPAHLDHFDRDNFVEELGDIFWYLAIACDSVGVTFEQVMESNAAKLRTARYKKGFSTEAANNRDIEQEKLAMDLARTTAVVLAKEEAKAFLQMMPPVGEEVFKRPAYSLDEEDLIPLPTSREQLETRIKALNESLRKTADAQQAFNEKMKPAVESIEDWITSSKELAITEAMEFYGMGRETAEYFIQIKTLAMEDFYVNGTATETPTGLFHQDDIKPPLHVTERLSNGEE